MMNFRRNLLISLGLLVLLGFQNCGPSFQQIELASSAVVELTHDMDLFKVSLNESLLTADQVYASMAEVTGVSPGTDTFQEWNTNARTALSDNNKVVSITAPMMMTTANLGSRFCAQTLSQDAAKSRLYPDVNLTKGVSSLTTENVSSSLRSLALTLWGRDLSEEELGYFLDYRNEFVASLSAAERNQPAKTVTLYLGFCTAMLGSYEALSL